MIFWFYSFIFQTRIHVQFQVGPAGGGKYKLNKAKWIILLSIYPRILISISAYLWFNCWREIKPCTNHVHHSITWHKTHTYCLTAIVKMDCLVNLSTSEMRGKMQTWNFHFVMWKYFQMKVPLWYKKIQSFHNHQNCLLAQIIMFLSRRYYLLSFRY